MQSSAAADRIAALQRHLQSHQVESDVESSIEAQNTKADANPKERPAPGGGPGTLSVVDNRTGKKYEIPISDHGTIKGTELKKITAGGDGVGLRPYDNGQVARKSMFVAHLRQRKEQCVMLIADMSTLPLSSQRYPSLTVTRASYGIGATLLNSLQSAQTSSRSALIIRDGNFDWMRCFDVML